MGSKGSGVCGVCCDALGAGPRDRFKDSSIRVTSLGDSGLAGGLYVVGVGFGGRVGVWACAGSYLLGGLAECSIVEDVGCGNAVVSGGHFVDVLGDVAQNLDELEAVVGHIEDGLGEFEGRV